MAIPRYEAGDVLAGRYTVTGTLGTGGTSGVFRAHDTVMNRTVAIKVISMEGSENASKSFMTEARAAALLSHPNIVNVYDILDLDGEKYIIMEYVCGITLRDYLDYRGHLSPKECVNCAHQVLRALHAAHNRGIVHRDIKPRNLLITTEGRVKVTDFGIARLPDRDSFLMPDRTVGTVHYISPEQAKGGALDERSDLYSLGIVMYEMLTGRRPFEAERPADVAMMQVSSRPLPPRERNPHIPEALEKIVLCAMEKEPAARFDSAAEMLRILSRLSEDQLLGTAAPHREEASAYRLATERLDDRTMPLPRVKGQAPAPAREEPAETVVEDARRTPAARQPSPPPPPAPAPTPTVGTIGNMRDAFTAEDTVDIMKPQASTPASRPIEEDEPLILSRRTPIEDDTAELGEVTETMTIPSAAPAPKKDKPHGMLFAGESRFFTVFMIVAALILAVILLVGVIKGAAAPLPPAEDGVTLCAPLKGEHYAS